MTSAAAAELSLTDGVREMRAIAGMTQEEFARHREVSARVIKAIELGQGNPAVAMLNRIGQFFSLEVGFVPIRRTPAADGFPQPAAVSTESHLPPSLAAIQAAQNDIMRNLHEAIDAMNTQLGNVESLREIFEGRTSAFFRDGTTQENAPAPKKRKTRLP